MVAPSEERSKILFVKIYKFCCGDVTALRKLIFQYPPTHIFNALQLSGPEYQATSTKKGIYYKCLLNWRYKWENEEGVLEQKVHAYVPPEVIDEFTAADPFPIEDVMSSVNGGSNNSSEDSKRLFVKIYKFCCGDVTALHKLIFQYPPTHIFNALQLSGPEYQSKTKNRKAGKYYLYLSSWRNRWENEEGVLEQKVHAYVPPEVIDEFTAADPFPIEDVMSSVPAIQRRLNLVERLSEYKIAYGHCYPPLQSKDPNYTFQSLARRLSELRTDDEKYDRLPDKVKDDLQQLGWDRTKDPREERSKLANHAKDLEMVAKLWEFYMDSSPCEEKRHTWVPHPRRTDDPELWALYYWQLNVRMRINDPDDFAPLADEVKERLKEMKFIVKPIPHFGVYRAENRHFVQLDCAMEKVHGSRIYFDVEDTPHVKNDLRRPDRVLYSELADGIDRMIIVEYDECAHDDRSEESEQKKVYNQCIDFLFNNVFSDVRDIHIVRVNGGYTPFPDEDLALEHAKILHKIMSSPPPKKLPYVTVHMLNFDEDHKHVNAYHIRMIDPDNKIDNRARDEDQWDNKPMYDEVILYTMENNLET